MTLPTGFYKSKKSNGKVCKLMKGMYGLKHAPRQWFSKFSAAILDFGFVQSLNDYSLFTYTKSGHFLALLVYVNDIVLTGTSNALIAEVKLFIDSQFKVKDLGPLKRLVGQLIYLTVTRPDLSFPLHVLSQFTNAPIVGHLAAAHKVLRYVKGAPTQGLLYATNQPFNLQAYCDADWGSCPITRKSVS
ncbi:unnamed protein product [Rhodiola kirilowii]